MEGETNPVNDFGVIAIEGIHDNATLDTVSHCNLNDLQNYLVNFNKEIEVNNDGGISLQHTLAKVSTPSSRPMFVSLPVSSESTSPDEEQLPAVAELKPDKPLSVDSSLSRPLSSLSQVSDGEATADHMICVEMTPKDSPEELSNPSADCGDSMEAVGVDIEGDSQLEALGSGQVQLQELNLEQNSQFGLQNLAGVDGGMVVLPMGDLSSILSSADQRYLQVVTINGQPALQLVGGSNLAPQQIDLPFSVEGDLSSISANTVVSSANNLLISQLASSQVVTDGSAQVVAVQGTGDNPGSQVMALDLEDILPISASSPSTTLEKRDTGYQSVAIMPTGDAGNQQQEVSYVLIVNQSGDEKTAQGQIVDLGNNLQGEIVEECVGENGTTKRLVKINGLPAKSNQQEVILSAQNNQEMILQTGNELICPVCAYTTPQRYLMKRHMKSHTADRPHRCGLCNRGFKSMSSLQNHINIHTGVRPHKCKLCESAFTTSGELVRHIRYKHTFEKPHKCTECEYASVELSKLKRHMRSHTGERPYACQYCNYASPDTYKLKRHMRIHTGEKPYQCDICSAKFTQSNSLKAHKLIHSGNKPIYQCPMCPATCGRNSDLKVHIQKLHGAIEQPLACKKCNAKFPDRYSFKIHMKSHEGEKCYKCPVCEYAAISQRSLDAHMFTHTGMKAFECKDCDLAFRQKQLLKRHAYLYHNPMGNPEERKSLGCRECDKNFNIKNEQEETEDSTAGYDESDEREAGVHTCGGCAKSQVEIVPLSADQLIENSLLADMKDGKLGSSPKVVVVHPDGRVEEVTAKLQSLSQSKPMDDFLVSLGVSGESHFDQVASLPGDVSVAEVSHLMSVADGVVLHEMDDSEAAAVNEEAGDDDEDKKPFTTSVIGIPDKLTSGDVTGFNSSGSLVKIPRTTGSLDGPGSDSEEEVDVEGFKVSEVSQESVTSVPHVIINVLHNGQPVHSLKRAPSEADGPAAKQARIITINKAEPL